MSIIMGSPSKPLKNVLVRIPDTKIVLRQSKPIPAFTICRLLRCRLGVRIEMSASAMKELINNASMMKGLRLIPIAIKKIGSNRGDKPMHQRVKRAERLFIGLV